MSQLRYGLRVGAVVVVLVWVVIGGWLLSRDSTATDGPGCIAGFVGQSECDRTPQRCVELATALQTEMGHLTELAHALEEIGELDAAHGVDAAASMLGVDVCSEPTP